jgi:acetyl esterase
MLLHLTVILSVAITFFAMFSLFHTYLLFDDPDCFVTEIRTCEFLLSSFQDAESDPKDSDIDRDVRAVMLRRGGAPDRHLRALEKALAGNVSELSRFRAAWYAPPRSQFLVSFDTAFDGPRGRFTARTFRPLLPFPRCTLLFIHGGGWIGGGVSSAHYITMHLAKLLNFEVVSVAYSLSPEAEPGVALEECAVVWRAIPRNHTVFVCGESSGGNLAAGLILKLARGGEARLPDAAILVYPATDLANHSYFSWRRFAKGYGLDTHFMKACISAYVRNPRRRTEPWFSPVYGNLTRFPPTLVLTAQFDILRDEARAFAVRLRDAGRRVRYRCVEGTIHAFFSHPGLPKSRATVQREIETFVKSVLTITANGRQA